MTYTFIINPIAGRARIPGLAKSLRAAAREQGFDIRIVYTERRGHAAELAASAAVDSDVVVAVGGDGTIHEVVSGLVSAGAHARLGIVPSGTGNDFAKMFALPRRIEDLLRVFQRSDPVHVDYGRITWEGPDGSGATVFANVAGAGFDAKVAAAAAGFKMLRGTLRYLAAVMRTLRAWESPHVNIILFRDGGIVSTLDEHVLLTLAGNGRCAAGGFYLTPAASVVDGMLDVCVVRKAPIGRIMRLIPRVLGGGGHEGEPEVEMRMADAMEIRSPTPVPVQADGEVLTERATYIRIEVEVGGLPVAMPVHS